MRIAQLSPVWERVPPVKYGGIELVVYLLTEELVKRGHEVHLFASGDSHTSGKLESIYPVAQRELLGNPVPDLLHVTHAFLRASEFDVIHNHTGYSGIAFANFISTPVLNTLHGIFTAVNKPFFSRFESMYYNSISDEQRRDLPTLNYIATIYNAIDISSYPYSATKKDYFVSLGRVCALKGTHLAAEIAKKAGVRLLIAGKVDAGRDTDYYHERVEPHLEEDKIVFLGEISEEEKRKLLRDAKGFLFPLQWSEPFGLVMIEAMACGTPVVAFPYGAVPEVVKDRETGFIVRSIEEMVDAVRRIDQIDPQKCRDHVVEQFGVARMVDDYEAIYKRIISESEKGLARS
jgi:glycosyltransferase involved in cell wall biosynthesis